MVQEKVAAVSAAASDIGSDPTAFSRLAVASLKAFEVGTSVRSRRAGGCAASPGGAGTKMTSTEESMFEMTNKIAGEQRPARVADVIVLHT